MLHALSLMCKFYFSLSGQNKKEEREEGGGKGKGKMVYLGEKV